MLCVRAPATVCKPFFCPEITKYYGSEMRKYSTFFRHCFYVSQFCFSGLVPQSTSSIFFDSLTYWPCDESAKGRRPHPFQY